MKRRMIPVLILILLGLAFRLWLGLYHHDEFAETHLFLKHRPIWKWIFYTPLGLSDLTMKDLSPEEQEEQRLFEEFFSSKGLSK
ncbi:hypothetical protein [Rufibacter hautae]|uniref:Uncharacterized protein n=1 Tax=Rufibacter hautae TaxID=2595005 RepID=A0A5B6TE10_9BACT|nr:hypothetical protein [Rufibacter hautae]KAA3438396.1 hypothetical protein FOA19_14240 [Rufibacter hautae]